MKLVTTYRYIFLYICLMTLYEIICPISNGRVWVGITKNVELRFTQHMWGQQGDTKEKAEWCSLLKSKKLIPILNIVETGLSLDEAKRKEKTLIIENINSGANLFNVNDRKMYYQYTKEGALVDVFFTQEEARAKVGALPKMDRLTSGGFVWSHGEFDGSKVDAYKKSKQVRCKKVQQISKSGEVINTFDGVREACRITGIDHRSIFSLS